MSNQQGINRRIFLGSTGIGFTGAVVSALMTNNIASAKNNKVLKLSKEENVNPCDVKVNVKTVFGAYIHSGVWEGPCRFGPSALLTTPEQERARFRNSFKRVVENDKKRFGTDVNFLDPVYYEYTEELNGSFTVGDDDIADDLFQKLENDKVDLYLIHGNTFGQYFHAIVGRSVKKPTIGIGGLLSESTAYLRSIGLEAYVVKNDDELNKLIQILRARKVFQQTNILYFTNRGRKLKRNSSVISDYEDLKERFGIVAQIATYKVLSDEMNRVKKSKDTMEKVEDFADRLIKNARAVHIDRKYVINSIEYHFAVKNLLKKYNSNATLIECREFCASKLPEKWKIVPCLTNSILNSEGLPAGCEGDMNAMLAMRVLMSLSKKAAMMGNLGARGENIVAFGHDVSTMKMNGFDKPGFDKPDIPYELRNFVHSGWGTKIQVDLTKIKEKTATLARFDPLAKRILVTKGEVYDLIGFGKSGCALNLLINVPGSRQLVDKKYDYGPHFAMVYGDYTQELIKLGEMLKVEVEYHNL